MTNAIASTPAQLSGHVIVRRPDGTIRSEFDVTMALCSPSDTPVEIEQSKVVKQED